MLEQVRQELLDHIRAAEISKAKSVVEDWTKNHGSESTLTDLVEPVLRYGGELWSRGEDLNLAQGYIATRVIEDSFASQLDRGAESRNAVKGPVILGNAEDDFHFLGRKMVTAFLRASGWQVIDLGNDVPAEDFVDRAVEADARIIGISAMTYTNARNIRRVRETIDERGLTDRIRLAVGGAVFVLRPELVEEVGGDGTAANAIDTPRLFDLLWSPTVEVPEAQQAT
jgi:methylmalonyl-CoA mutase cobalamin-binding domain/chain